jgi:hypothetical protein
MYNYVVSLTDQIPTLMPRVLFGGSERVEIRTCGVTEFDDSDYSYCDGTRRKTRTFHSGHGR